jgi:hypothetical protein
VAIILAHDADKIPADIQALVRAGVENGVALAGPPQDRDIHPFGQEGQGFGLAGRLHFRAIRPCMATHRELVSYILSIDEPTSRTS